MITLTQLLTVAPFSDNDRAQLMATLPSLSEERQQELSNICWDLILKQYQANYAFTLQQQAIKAATTQDSTAIQPAQEVEDELVLDLQKKFAAAGSNVVLQEVRQQLGSLQKPQS
jgi:hypothetical protein